MTIGKGNFRSGPTIGKTNLVTGPIGKSKVRHIGDAIYDREMDELYPTTTTTTTTTTA